MSPSSSSDLTCIGSKMSHEYSDDVPCFFKWTCLLHLFRSFSVCTFFSICGLVSYERYSHWNSKLRWSTRVFPPPYGSTLYTFEPSDICRITTLTFSSQWERNFPGPTRSVIFLTSTKSPLFRDTLLNLSPFVSKLVQPIPLHAYELPRRPPAYFTPNPWHPLSHDRSQHPWLYK